MKLVFVGNGLHHTDDYPTPKVGGSVQTWYLSRELARRGHEVYIIRRNAINIINIIDCVNLVGIDIKGINAKAPPRTLLFYMFSQFSQLRFSKKSSKIVKKLKPDIICLIDRMSGIFPSFLRLPKVFVIHVPDALDFFKSYNISAKKLNVFNFYLKKIIQGKVMYNVDKIVVLNKYIENYLRKIGYENVVRIPNGIDVENFSNRGDEGFILYAGRFDWNKNVCSLVNVFSQICRVYPDFRLYLVGAGPEEKKIKSLVKEKGIQSRVKIIPWMHRSKLMKLMSKCSVFVLPSFFEVNPVVVLEAMASAKPVIARANMGTVDIISHGKNGYLYSKDEELKNYLEMLLSDDNLRKKIGRDARKTVEQDYTFSRIADKYEELFYELITRRGHCD